MDWERLLGRAEFQRDTDWIVRSAAFRSLEGKTQVFPPTGYYDARTRLTHSIEVANVGRDLGTRAAEIVAKHEGRQYRLPVDFGNLLAAACLAHDIGNPPFGHAGEEAIRDWFGGRGTPFLAKLSADERRDFIGFDGNPQGLRILTRARGPGGLRLTKATLAVFSKYPYRSTSDGQKFGVFHADLDTFRDIANTVGLVETAPDAWCRHPLTFLLEAADDICYCLNDLEDAFRAGCVSRTDVEQLLAPIALLGQRRAAQLHYRHIADDVDRVDFLITRSIGRLVRAVHSAFSESYDEVMAGTLTLDLLSRTRFRDEVRAIREVSSVKIYRSSALLQTQSAVYGIVGTLLDHIVPISLGGSQGAQVTPELVELAQRAPVEGTYEQLQHATDFLSNLRDSTALGLADACRSQLSNMRGRSIGNRHTR